MLRKRNLLVLSMLLATTSVAVLGNECKDISQLNLIPYPSQVSSFDADENFSLGADSFINCSGDEQLEFAASFLSQKLNLSIKNISSKGNINLTINKNLKEKEGYKLNITAGGISIVGNSKAGVFYGVQTLLQLYSLDINGKYDISKKLPLVKIVDLPRFEYRSFMLDSSRHFQNIATIKRLIDNLAAVKMNYFHWHLVDDQGWRFEVKKYPQLTQKGAFLAKDHMMERAGFYTQEELREVVAYAKQRNIIIIPELDVPGHSNALLEAFAAVRCKTKEKKEKLGSTICVSNEETYKVLDDVYKELIDVFQPPFVHIGRDEVKGDIWEKCEYDSAIMKKNNFKNLLN